MGVNADTANGAPQKRRTVGVTWAGAARRDDNRAANFHEHRNLFQFNADASGPEWSILLQKNEVEIGFSEKELDRSLI